VNTICRKHSVNKGLSVCHKGVARCLPVAFANNTWTHLLVLDVVRHLANVRHAALEVPRSREVPRSAREQRDGKLLAGEEDLALEEGAEDDGEAPVVGGVGASCCLEVARLVMIPGVHGLGRGRGKGAGVVHEYVVLQ